MDISCGIAFLIGDAALVRGGGSHQVGPPLLAECRGRHVDLSGDPSHWHAELDQPGSRLGGATVSVSDGLDSGGSSLERLAHLSNAAGDLGLLGLPGRILSSVTGRGAFEPRFPRTSTSSLSSRCIDHKPPPFIAPACHRRSDIPDVDT